MKNLFFLLLMVLGVRASEPVSLITTGPVEERINIVWLTDGYDQADHAAKKGFKNAMTLSSGLLTLSPWNTNAGRFNFSVIPLVSKESGITKTVNKVRTVKDTALGSELGFNNQKNAMYARDVFLVRERFSHLFPKGRVYFVILANEGSSGGGEMGGVTLATRGASPGLVSHELMGHAIAKLADEHEGILKYYVQDGVNVARSTNDVPWASLIRPGTRIPTPNVTSNDAVVGVFKRGLGFVPQRTCLMHAVDKPPCVVCLEAMTREILKP